MRGRMANHLQPIGILVGDDRQIRIAIDQERRINQLAVYLAGESCFGEASANRCGNRGHSYRRIKLTLRAIGKSD